jgi:Tol biopolymer transport system component
MPAAAPNSSSVIAAAPPTGGIPRWMMAGGALILIAGAAAAARLWPGAPTVPAPARESVTVDSVVSITSEDGVESFPSLSPDGKWVVYAASEQGGGPTDILLRAVGGQTTINLTKDSPSDDTHPAFSRDGERIAFRSNRDGGGIFVMGRTGESVRRVSSEGLNPAWSPDGRMLAYVSEPASQPYGRGTRSALSIVDVSSGERRKLPVEDAMQPAWSPNGQRIVYWGLRGDSVQRDLWTVAVSGGEPLRLTDDPAVDWSPVWSPDGRFVYYASDATGQQNLWRIGVDEATGEPRGRPEAVTLPRPFLGHLSFAADGSMLAATSFTTQSNVELLTLDPTATKVTSRRRVTNVSENTSSPSIAADGQSIVFWRNSNGQEDLWVVMRDGTGLRRLTNDPAHDRNPQFTPDGRRILFYSDRGGRYQIWTMDRDGGDPRQVTDYPGLVIQARMTGDGTRAFANVPLAVENILFDPRLPAAKQQIERLPPFPGRILFNAWSWSPDGRYIAGFPSRAAAGIFVYDLSARTFQEINEAGTFPVWLRDGRQILYRSADVRALDVVDTQTRKVRRVFSTGRENIASLDISPNGTEVAAVIVNQQADIVLAKLAVR